MTEIEKKVTTDNKNEDWAVIPFDETEDDERWAKLIEEMDGLEKKCINTETIFGELLSEENLNQNQTGESRAQTENEKLFETEPF